MFQVFQMTKGESSDELVLGDPSPHEERNKKKRNRVLQSCIPCHELRRKCDRLRPCTRCSEHGVAGQCVYQLEDPAARQGPDQDELSRLRRRVAELEHTVRVLTQRSSPREAFDEKNLQGSSSRAQGTADDEDFKRKKGRRDDTPSSGGTVPGAQGRSPSSAYPGHSVSGSPRGSPGGHLAGSPHCGCALSSAGREILGQLQTNLNGSIQRLKALPEHRGHGVNCPLYAQAVNLQDHLRQVSVPSTTSFHHESAAVFHVPMPTLDSLSRQSVVGSGTSTQHAAYGASLPVPSYGLQSPYAPSTSTHSSASPPQGGHDFYAGLSQSGTYDLGSPVQPTQPYPYTASHSSTLSHSMSHPQLSSSTSAAHPHAYGQMPSLGSTAGGFHQYQPQSVPQQAQQNPAMMGEARRSGASGAVPVSGYTSLSTWNTMSATQQQGSSQRPSSKTSRSSGAVRPNK